MPAPGWVCIRDAPGAVSTLHVMNREGGVRKRQKCSLLAAAAWCAARGRAETHSPPHTGRSG